METKGKVRSFADIFGEDVAPNTKQQAGVTEVEISKLAPFANHPFKNYEGERLNDMVTSIKELGVILPVVVRPKDNDGYEILSGHNRVNAAKIAGFEKVPTIIKEGLTDEEANLIVTETNLLQRSFADLSHSERAVALSKHNDKNDIMNSFIDIAKKNAGTVAGTIKDKEAAGYLKWCKKEVSKCVDEIVGNKCSESYYIAANLLVTMNELMNISNTSEVTDGLLAYYYKKYSRYSAFRKEIIAFRDKCDKVQE